MELSPARSWSFAALALTAALTVTACANGQTVSSRTTSSSAPTRPARLYLRPVLCEAPPYVPRPGSPSATPTGSPPPCAAQAQAGAPTPTDPALAGISSTPPGQDDPNATVLLSQKNSSGNVVLRYELGPAVLDGSVIQSANAAVPQNGGSWQVNFSLNSAGSAKFDAIAQQYYRRQIAVEFGGEVLSAPTINAQSFGGQGQITGDFTESRAKSLAEQILRAR